MNVRHRNGGGNHGGGGGGGGSFHNNNPINVYVSMEKAAFGELNWRPSDSLDRNDFWTSSSSSYLINIIRIRHTHMNAHTECSLRMKERHFVRQNDQACKCIKCIRHLHNLLISTKLSPMALRLGLVLLLPYMLMIAVNFMTFLKMPDEIVAWTSIAPKSKQWPTSDKCARISLSTHKMELVSAFTLGTLLFHSEKWASENVHENFYLELEHTLTYHQRPFDYVYIFQLLPILRYSETLNPLNYWSEKLTRLCTSSVDHFLFILKRWNVLSKLGIRTHSINWKKWHIPLCVCTEIVLFIGLLCLCQ